MEFGEVANKVAIELPDGWNLVIDIDGNCGGYDVQLWDDNGDEVCDFSSNHDSMEQTIFDAIEHAQHLIAIRQKDTPC